MDKQDKIVIFAGIVILIISIAGILYHEKTYVATSEEIKKTEYVVSWIEYSDEIVDNGFVGRDGWGASYSLDIDYPSEGKEYGVITAVDIILEWSDNLDFHGLILPWNWSDLVEMNVKIDELGFSQSAKGYGKIELHVEKGQPQDFTKEAENETQLYEYLAQNALNEVNCKINLSITPKPRFFDRGNDFIMRIVYHYYVPEIKVS